MITLINDKLAGRTGIAPCSPRLIDGLSASCGAVALSGVVNERPAMAPAAAQASIHALAAAGADVPPLQREDIYAFGPAATAEHRMWTFRGLATWRDPT